MIQVEIIEEDHEKDLMESVNDFLKKITEENIVDIKYSICHFQSELEQIYSFSCCIIYRIKKE